MYLHIHAYTQMQIHKHKEAVTQQNVKGELCLWPAGECTLYDLQNVNL